MLTSDKTDIGCGHDSVILSVTQVLGPFHKTPEISIWIAPNSFLL